MGVDFIGSGKKVNWSTCNLRRLILNKCYIGVREINKKNKGKDQDKLKSFEKYAEVSGQWESIISDETFKKAGELIEISSKRERERINRGQRRSFLLSGLLKCPDCGGALIGHTAHGKNKVHRYYGHASTKGKRIDCQFSRVRADSIETGVSAYLSGLLERQGLFENLETQMKSESSQAQRSLFDERSQLQSEYQSVMMEVDEVLKLNRNLEDGSVLDLLKGHLKALSEKRQKVKARLTEVEELLEGFQEKSAKVSSLKDAVHEFERGFKKAGSSKQKQILRTIFDRLVPEEDGLHVWFKLGEEQERNELAVREEEGCNGANARDGGSRSLTGAVRTFVRIG